MAEVDPAFQQAMSTIRLVAEDIVQAARRCGDERGADAILYLWVELRDFVKADQAKMPAPLR